MIIPNIWENKNVPNHHFVTTLSDTLPKSRVDSLHSGVLPTKMKEPQVENVHHSGQTGGHPQLWKYGEFHPGSMTESIGRWLGVVPGPMAQLGTPCAETKPQIGLQNLYVDP